MYHAVYVKDVAHVIVDNLQFMMGTSGAGSLDRCVLVALTYSVTPLVINYMLQCNKSCLQCMY